MHFISADLAKMGFLERWNRNKNNSERVYTKRRPLETVGSIIFVFCKPLFVIGLILTIVIYTEKDPTDSISSFRIIGPVFLSLSAVFFVFGGFMTSPYFPLVLERCKRKKNTTSSIAATGVNKEEPAVKTVRVHPLKTADPSLFSIYSISLVTFPRDIDVSFCRRILKSPHGDEMFYQTG